MTLIKSSLSMLLAIALTTGMCLPGSAQKAKGAKGLFLEQMDSPEKELNTGVEYYIELHRGEQVIKVNNKHRFRSGDRIKFHVKSNINGYAYILLSSGSRGEQSVLFPDPAAGDNNRVRRGTDYVLPEIGYLTFDDNPGMEKVTLLLSRTPINAQAYLNKPVEAPTLIASAMTGSKDLIPQKVLVAYSNPNKVFPSNSLKVAKVSTKTKPTPKAKPKPKVQKQTQIARKPKPKKTKKTRKSRPTRIAKKPKPKTKPTIKQRKSEPSRATEPVVEVATKQNDNLTPIVDQDESVVTVVSELPGNILHIDVDLQHI